MSEHRKAAFGDLLRQRRIQAGLSQERLAEMARVSAGAIGALERGLRRAPYTHTLALLIEALGLNGEERAELEAAAGAARIRRRVDVVDRAKAMETGARVRALPVPVTPLVGRAEDAASVVALLADSRAVTVTGSGGIGKTRLALEVAARVRTTPLWEDVWFVDLTSISDPALIAGKIAAAIEPRPSVSVDTLDGLVDALAERRVLLVLDNCEHLIGDMARAVTALAEGCPHVAILATSREALNIRNESIHRLMPLTFPIVAPATLAETTAFSALDLFVQRSGYRDPSVTFTDDSVGYIFNICRRLEGIPLAIELAVARLPFLGLKMLDARLDDHFALPGAPRDLPRRQLTMQATIAWSFELLEKPEQELLTRLSVFSGGFTLDSAQIVCTGDEIGGDVVLHSLASLVDKSLVNVVQTKDSVRYVLLDSVRAFATQLLDGWGKRDRFARQHARWLAQIGEESGPNLNAEKFADLAPEIDNARAALVWALNSADGDDRALAARIVGGLPNLWAMLSRDTELLGWIRQVIGSIDEERHPVVAAKLLHIFISRAFNETATLAVIARAIPLFDRLGNSVETARFHMTLTFIFASHALFDDAHRSARRVESIFASERSRASMDYARFLYCRAMLNDAEMKFDAARSDVAASELVATALGDRYYVIRRLWLRMLLIENRTGNNRRAIEIGKQMLASEHGAIADINRHANESLAILHLLVGDADAAEAAARAVLAFMRADESLIVQYVAAIVAFRGHPHEAARLMGFSEALLNRNSSQRDTLQQQNWEQLCEFIERQLDPNVAAIRQAEGAALSAHAAATEALAALALRAPGISVRRA